MLAVCPIASLTPATSVLTRAYLTIIQSKINSNAISISLTMSLTYGHLMLNVTPTIYASYGANTFPVPNNPGLNPKIDQNNPTAQ